MMSLAQRGMNALETGYSPAWLQRRLQPGPGRRRRRRAPHPHARRPALGRRHQLHARPRRHPRDEPDARGQLQDGPQGRSRSMAITAPPAEIFKAYDIRGLYGEQMDAETAHLIGRGFARVLAKLRGKETSELRVGLGHDMRLTGAGDGRRGAAGARRGGRHGHRRRPDRDRDELLPRGLARARRRSDGHRLAQPEEVHGRQADARGRAGPVGRRRHPGRPRRDRGRPARSAREAAQSRRSTSTPTSTST